MKLLLYIDPSSGSMLFQALIAGTLGAIMFFKQIKYKIKSFFSSSESDETKSKQ